MKKTKTITIRVDEELMKMIEFNAREERRKIGELVALWVEDVAIVETRKKTDKGTNWSRPQYTKEKEIILQN